MHQPQGAHAIGAADIEDAKRPGQTAAIVHLHPGGQGRQQEGEGLEHMGGPAGAGKDGHPLLRGDLIAIQPGEERLAGQG